MSITPRQDWSAIYKKGHSLRRSCLQPATNMYNSKPTPPTVLFASVRKRKGKNLKLKLHTTTVAAQQRLTTPLHISPFSGR